MPREEQAATLPQRWAVSSRKRPFNRRTKEDVRKEVDDQFKEECTFQPKINKVKNSSKLARETRAERLRRLSSSNAEKIAKREKRKLELEQEYMKECTFAPKVNKRRPKSAAPKRKDGGGEGEILASIGTKFAMKSVAGSRCRTAFITRLTSALRRVSG